MTTQQSPNSGYMAKMKLSLFQQYRQKGLTVPIRLHSPLLRMFLLAIGCATFTIGGIGISFAAEDIGEKMIAILCIAFFGGIGAIVLLPFLTMSDIALFDREGFYTRRYAVKILWVDVRAVGIVETKGYETLCVAVENYERYRTQIPWNAIWMRAIYHTLPGRLGAVALIAALDPSEAKEAWDSLSDTKGFDFLWSHHEFPSMRIKEVRDIIEIESRKARGIS